MDIDDTLGDEYDGQATETALYRLHLNPWNLTIGVVRQFDFQPMGTHLGKSWIALKKLEPYITHSREIISKFS